MPFIRLRASHFRKLDRFDWTPQPVSAIVGPNGAGKTTILDLLRFMQMTFLRGHGRGLLAAGGGDHMLTRGCGPTDLVEVDLLVDDLRWHLRLPMSAAGLKGTYGEELYRGDELILRAGVHEDRWHLGSQELHLDDERCCARVLWDRGEPPWMRPLYDAMYDLRAYDFWLHTVAQGTTREDASSFLHGHGKNLWAVLARWQQAPSKFRGQFDWVVGHARKAFPDLLGSIEFVDGEALVFPPNSTDPADGLPPRRQPDGLLTGLLQLTALAGAKRGSLVAFDEMENQLHPHAIRTILAATREIAAERDLKVILTTHSPVVLDAFRDNPEQVFVLEPSATHQPLRLVDLKNPAWLSLFSIGDLYARESFGSPPEAAPTATGGNGEGG